MTARKPAKPVETLKRMSVYISPELFRRAKVAAAMRGMSLSALVAGSIELLIGPEGAITLQAIPPRMPRKARRKR